MWIVHHETWEMICWGAEQRSMRRREEKKIFAFCNEGTLDIVYVRCGRLLCTGWIVKIITINVWLGFVMSVGIMYVDTNALYYHNASRQPRSGLYFPLLSFLLSKPRQYTQFWIHHHDDGHIIDWLSFSHSLLHSYQSIVFIDQVIL